MSCVFVAQIPIYGINESPIYSQNELPNYGVLPPCSLTLRDQFAMASLVALASDQTYRFSSNEMSIDLAVTQAYSIADKMLKARN